EALEAPGMLGHGLAQIGQAHHGWILVVAVQQIIRCRGSYRFRPLVVGEALAEVDRLLLPGKRRHPLENRGSKARHYRIGRLHQRSRYCTVFAQFFALKSIRKLIERSPDASIHDPRLWKILA